MSLRISIYKPCRIIYKHSTRYSSNRKLTTHLPIQINKHYFSTQQKDDGESTRKPRKLVMSPYSTHAPQEIHKSTQTNLKQVIENMSSENQSERQTETERQHAEIPQSKSKSKSKSKLNEYEKYAFDILNHEVLEQGSKQEMDELSADEKRLYKVVQHLINEGFIDELELLKLGEKRKQIAQHTSHTFDTFEKENIGKTSGIELDENNLNKWREGIIKEMDENVINYKNINANPLLINMKEFMSYKTNKSDRDPLLQLNELDKNDSYYELQLDDRDLKHILIYLIYNHLHSKRFYELNPSIKELANLLYGIKTQTDFNRLLNIMSRTRKQILHIMQSYPKQSTANIVINYDKITDTGIDLEYPKYDQYAQNIQQTERNMTSFELDNTIKRIQDLEFRQYGYTQAQLNTYDETDNEFIKLVQNEDEADAESIAKSEQIKQEINETNPDDAYDKKNVKGYYNSVMDKVQQQWNGDVMGMDIPYVGGDWRVRLGIAERQIDRELDFEQQVHKQYERQLNESIAYTTRKRYRISPWKIKSLPYAEAKELDIHFTNLKLLNKFVNDRGMILPRRFTGVDKKTQKCIAKSIKRARKIGFMPHMSKLLILDKQQIQKKKKDLQIKNHLQNEKNEYDLIHLNDLQSMYPEYAPNDNEYINEKNILEKNKAENEQNDNDELEINFDAQYDIDANELMYETQLRKHQNIFMKQIKQDIIKKIPEYWQKRLSFRDKSNALVNKMHNRNKRNKFKSKYEKDENKLLGALDRL